MGPHDSLYYAAKMCNDSPQMLSADALADIHIYIIGGVMWNCFVVHCCMMDGCLEVSHSANRISESKYICQRKYF